MKIILISLISLFTLTTRASISRFAHPTQLIIEVDESLLSLKSNIFTSYKVLGPSSDKSLGTKKTLLVELPSLVKSSLLLSEIKNTRGVSWVLPNYIYQGDYQEIDYENFEFLELNDPKFKKQHFHEVIMSKKAWSYQTELEEVIVAVTDDGFKMDHDDLKNIYAVNAEEIPDNGIDDDGNGYIDDVSGWDFNTPDNNPDSDKKHGGHGTHVAGIIAAQRNNEIGVVGTAPNVRIMPIKFYGKAGWSSAMIYESYRYATDNKARIISTSYNIDSMVEDKVYIKAVDYAHSRGVLIFNSAGNGKREQPRRIMQKKVLLVASTTCKEALNSRDTKSSFSNYGYGVDISAPGDPILSAAITGAYKYSSGTSMATPVAAAIAAMIWGANPQWTREMVVSRLLMSSEDISKQNPLYKDKLGAGRVNSYFALKNESEGPSIRSVSYLKKEKEIRVHLRGILASNNSKSRFKKSFQLLRDGKKLSLRLKEKLELGSNFIKLDTSRVAKGEYKLRITGQYLVDPFGQELDADSNGLSGGDLEMNIVID